MTGLELLKAPNTTPEEIADIISEHCPPLAPENCDNLSCRRCWLAWLTEGDPAQRERASAEPTPSMDEIADELSCAAVALEGTVQIIQQATKGEQQRKLLSGLSTFGRLLEKERNVLTATDQEKIAYLVRGIIAESVHFFATPIDPNMVEAEFIDTVRRKLAARFIFERRFGGYYIKFVELFPL